jgi:hypothetical protein
LYEEFAGSGVEVEYGFGEGDGGLPIGGNVVECGGQVRE